MPENFENEMKELSDKLKKADGYLACEQVVLQNIKKYFDVDAVDNDVDIEQYIKKLSDHIEDRITANQDKYNCTNYRYAAGFLNILLRTPCRMNWIKTIET